MGCCRSETVIQINHQNSLSTYNSTLLTQNNFKPDYGDSKFNDFPEWEGERYSGIGIKRMKGYICNLPIDELINLRNEFWKYHKAYEGGDFIWQNIRFACIMDEVRCLHALEKAELTPVFGRLNILVDKKNKLYFIPNFCINEPFFEKSFNKDKINKENEKIIKLILYETSLCVCDEFEVSNMISGKELKEIFAKKEGIDLVKRKLRMFFGGSEILDEHILVQHNLNDGYKIQFMIINL